MKTEELLEKLIREYSVFFKTLCREYPNDYDLGELIREKTKS